PRLRVARRLRFGAPDFGERRTARHGSAAAPLLARGAGAPVTDASGIRARALRRMQGALHRAGMARAPRSLRALGIRSYRAYALPRARAVREAAERDRRAPSRAPRPAHRRGPRDRARRARRPRAAARA